MAEIAIVIPSCDSYNNLWKGFFTLKDRYWNSDFKTYLVSETLSYPGVESILVNHPSWASRFKHALKQIPEEYIIIMLDDYYITDKVNNDKILKRFELMKKDNILSFGLTADHEGSKPFSGCPQYKEHDLVNIGNHQFKVCTAPGIWKKDILIQLLIDGESPWETEEKGKARAENFNPFVMERNESLIPIRQVYIRGKVRPTINEILKRENISI